MTEYKTLLVKTEDLLHESAAPESSTQQKECVDLDEIINKMAEDGWRLLSITNVGEEIKIGEDLDSTVRFIKLLLTFERDFPHENLQFMHVEDCKGDFLK